MSAIDPHAALNFDRNPGRRPRKVEPPPPGQGKTKLPQRLRESRRLDLEEQRFLELAHSGLLPCCRGLSSLSASLPSGSCMLSSSPRSPVARLLYPRGSPCSLPSPHAAGLA